MWRSGGLWGGAGLVIVLVCVWALVIGELFLFGRCGVWLPDRVVLIICGWSCVVCVLDVVLWCSR